MGHHSISGSGGHSSSHLDFVSYWADKTVKDAVLQGQQLRLQKAHPVPIREYNVVNIDFIKPPCSVKSSGRRRKKTVKVTTKRHRSRSPKTSPSSMLPRRKKRPKSKSIPPCGMRIAELAVPTKRHCLETWQDKYKTLPDYMIERLRQHVMDQRPVVQVSEAIQCFKRKCKRHKRTVKTVDKNVESKNKSIKNLLLNNEFKVLGAVFGYRIAKKLIVPLNIILNSDLEKIAGVISYDISDLMKRSKIDTKNKIYRLVERDIVKKVTIWVSGVLDESCEKILEDQLRDFEEEAGPALDCIDDLIDNVLDICIPVQETLEEYFTSKSDESGLGEAILELQVSSEKLDELQDVAVYENIEDYLKNELVTLINSIGKDVGQMGDEYLDVDEGSQLSENGETNESDKKEENFVESEESDTAFEKAGAEEDTAFEEADDVEGPALDQTDDEEAPFLEQGAHEEDADVEQLGNEEATDLEQAYDEEDTVLEQAEGEESVALEQIDNTDGTAFQEEENEEAIDIDIKENENLDSENAETEDTDITTEDTDANKDRAESNDDNNDEYLEPEDVTQPTGPVEVAVQITDDYTETFADATEDNNIDDYVSLSEDRKVTFGESVTDVQKSVIAMKLNASKENIEFSAPNEGLLSDADESWPEDVLPPVLRPSQSVSKSITSLGRIREVEEKLSIKPEEENKSEIEDKPIAADSGEQKEKKSKTDESIKSKDETASKDSSKKDSKAKRLSGSKVGKLPSKKSTPSASRSSPRKTSKIEMTPAPSKPVSKIPKKIKDKNLKSKGKDAESRRTSQSINDQQSDVKKKIEKMTAQVKSKPDYRVNVKTAPAWINRNFGEPSCSCVQIPTKSKVKPKVNENVVRRWCQDLEHGYENLKMWNEWVENTTKTVSVLQREIGKANCPERCSNKEWIKLKRNIDKDAYLWTKLNRHTQQRLKCYKRMYQKRSDIPSKYFICCEQQK